MFFFLLEKVWESISKIGILAGYLMMLRNNYSFFFFLVVKWRFDCVTMKELIRFREVRYEGRNWPGGGARG